MNLAPAGDECGFTVINQKKERAKMIHKMQNAHKLKDDNIEKVKITVKSRIMHQWLIFHPIHSNSIELH